MLKDYRDHVAKRAELGITPKPLDAKQVTALVELLKNPPPGEEEFIMDLITNRAPPGVDGAAYVKAGFLATITTGEAKSPLIDPALATKLLGTMLGGYNIATLIDCLDNAQLAKVATHALSHTLLVFDAFHDVKEKADQGNSHAQQILHSWAEGEWFTEKPKIPEKNYCNCI